MDTEYRFNTIEELRQSEEHRRLVMCIRKHKVHPTIESLSDYYFAYYDFWVAAWECKEAVDLFFADFVDEKDLGI